jgi:hypothetical protein
MMPDSADVCVRAVPPGEGETDGVVSFRDHRFEMVVTDGGLTDDARAVARRAGARANRLGEYPSVVEVTKATFLWYTLLTGGSREAFSRQPVGLLRLRASETVVSPVECGLRTRRRRG